MAPDALRFGVMRSAPLGADILFDDKNVELGRNFCTKLWNAARFRQMQGGATEGEVDPKLLTSDDQWILARLDDAVREVTAALEEYRFSDAAAALYRFFWNEYCDWYLESTKAALVECRRQEGRSRQRGEREWRGTAAENRLPQSQARRQYARGNGSGLRPHAAPVPSLPPLHHRRAVEWTRFQRRPARQSRWRDDHDRTVAESHERRRAAYFGLDEAADKFAAAKYEVVNLGRGLRRDFNIASNKRTRFVLRPNASLDATTSRCCASCSTPSRST